MAIIHFYSRNDDDELEKETISHDGSVISWILKNIDDGENFDVYDGSLSKDNEISRDEEKMLAVSEVSIISQPAGSVAAVVIVSLVVSVAVAALTKVDVPSSANNIQSSPNNDISSRTNQARPNQRIVDIVGTQLSIPDIIQRAYSVYVNNVEVQNSHYCIARNKVAVKDVKERDSFFSNINGYSAGIYYPYKSPNNSQPDIQIGSPINKPVVGVYESGDAIGQTISFGKESLDIYPQVRAYNAGYLEKTDYGFDTVFEAGDTVELRDLSSVSGNNVINFGGNTKTVISATSDRITFDTSNDSSWSQFDDGENVNRVFIGEPPRIIKDESTLVGPFKITSTKVDTLIINVYARDGLYKQSSNTSFESALVEFDVNYQILDEDKNPLGPVNVVKSSIEGSNKNEKGITVEIPLGFKTFVEYSLQRTTPNDTEFNGNVVDEIKLKSVFGLFDIDREHFGNVTTIQTQTVATEQAAAIKERQLSCIATELVYKYENGTFASDLTENNQAMQSLIRLAL